MNIISSVKALIRKYLSNVYIVRSVKGADGVDGRVVTYVDKYSHIAEQYNMLRANLYALSVENPIKTIVIASSHRSEGKTLTCCNLAVSLAQNKEKKTVLIDADFRNPSVHSMFAVPDQPGFMNILNGTATLESLVTRPVVDTLYIIPSGGAAGDHATFFNQANIKPVIDKLKQTFDYIIFDTPPVHEFGDAGILGSLCDAVFLVVKAGSTQEDAIEEAFNKLAEVQAKPRACILTNVNNVLKPDYLSGRRPGLAKKT